MKNAMNASLCLLPIIFSWLHLPNAEAAATACKILKILVEILGILVEEKGRGQLLYSLFRKEGCATRFRNQL